MLGNIKRNIQNNFSSLEIKIWLVVIVCFVSYFAGRVLGSFYSHLIH